MTNVTVELAVTPRSEELSFWHKAAYAIGELGNSAGPGTIIPFWYLYFLTSVALLDPALAGFVQSFPFSIVSPYLAYAGWGGKLDSEGVPLFQQAMVGKISARECLDKFAEVLTKNMA